MFRVILGLWSLLHHCRSCSESRDFPKNQIRDLRLLPLNGAAMMTNQDIVDASPTKSSTSPGDLQDELIVEEAEDGELSKIGIKLSYILKEFIPMKCGGKNALKGLSTGQVCEQFIKPITAEFQSSYCEYINSTTNTTTTQRQHGHSVGDADVDGSIVRKAEVFISHAHQCEFLTVIDALDWHFCNAASSSTNNDDEDPYIWLDIFCINQHRPTDWTFEWLSNTFKSTIQDFGRTVMVMSPWNDPLPFTRAWCIFEVYCTIDDPPNKGSIEERNSSLKNDTTNTNSAEKKGKGSFEIAMGELDRQTFLKAITSSSGQKLQDTVNGMLSNIRADKSQCSIEHDRRNIFRAIQTSVGFGTINSLVFAQYRDWVIKVTRHEVEKCDKNDYNSDSDTGRRRLDLIQALGVLHLGQGKYKEAAPFLHESYEQRRSLTVSPSTDPGVLLAMEYLGQLFFSEGNYEKAGSLFQDCMKKREQSLGQEHPATLDVMNHLAFNYYNQGLYSLARPLYTNCYHKRMTVLGKNHPDTLTSLNNLAALYYKIKEYDVARPLYEECLENRRKVLGRHHPDTLTIMNNVGLLYTQLGLFDLAVPLHEECYTNRKMLLGDNHPNTLSSLHNLGKLHEQMGNDDKARELHELCYASRKMVLGEDHPTTVKTGNSLARLAISVKPEPSQCGGR